MRMIASLIGLSLLVGCVSDRRRRAALVPRAVPRMTSGQPLTGAAQLSAGVSSVAHLGSPSGDHPSTGLEVPGTQLHGDLRARIGESASFGFIYEDGLDQGATKLTKTAPEVDGRTGVHGYGVSFDVSIRTPSPKFRVGVGADLIIWSAPYVEYETCARDEECFPFRVTKTGRDSATTFAASLTPSYRVAEGVALFGGVTMRHHPHIDQGDVFDEEPDVASGPLNFLVSGGAEVAFADGAVLASAVAYWDASRDPVKYKPGLGMLLSLPLGRRTHTP